jgi:pterin-4a-carbinolamine dehydratase
MKRATASVTRTPAPPAAPVPIKERLKAERIQELLQGLPGWRVAWGGRAVMRRYALPGHNSVAAFIENVGDLARKRGLRADLDLRPSRVTVRVVSRPARGLTMAEVNLASAIDEKE